jgi:hypothetical protein
MTTVHHQRRIVAHALDCFVGCMGDVALFTGFLLHLTALESERFVAIVRIVYPPFVGLARYSTI